MIRNHELGRLIQHKTSAGIQEWAVIASAILQEQAREKNFKIKGAREYLEGFVGHRGQFNDNGTKKRDS